MENSPAPAQNFLIAAVADLRRRPRGNVPCLDILRSTAILLVFSVHVGATFNEPLRITRFPFIYWGWTGVDLFFILSGYLIGGQLWKELKRTGTIQVARFILRRGFRIWPLYYSVLLLTFVAALIQSHALHGFWADLLFLSNYTDYTNVGGSWSLCIEEQFYIILPLVLWLGIRYVPMKRLVWIPAAWLLALPLIRTFLFHTRGSVNGSPFHTHSDGLAIGLLIAWLAAFYPDRMNAPLGKNALMLFCVVALAAFLHNGISRPTFGYSSLALFYGSITLFLLRLSNPPAWFNWSGFYVISRLSYGIYLNHFFVLDHLPTALKPYIGKGTVGFVLCWFIALFVVATIAFVTFAAIELPFLRIRETYLAKRIRVPAPLAEAPRI